MSIRFAIVVLSALVAPCAAAVSLAEEQKAEAQASCACTDCKCADGDNSDCKCTDCKCGEASSSAGASSERRCSDGSCAKGDCDKGNCTEGKCDSKCTECENCGNASCDKENCKCDESAKVACKCAAKGGSSCEQESSESITLTSGTSSKSECASSKCDKSACSGEGVACSGKQCSEGACCSEGKCSKNGDCRTAANGSNSGKCCEKSASATAERIAGSESSALRMAGQLLDFALPSPASPETDDMWQRVAAELDEARSNCQIGCGSQDITGANKTVTLILDSPSGGDCAIQSECNANTTIGSMLRGAVLPHPVNFSEAQIVICRPRTVTYADNSIEVEERILPVRWDPAIGEPTKCTNHTLQPNDRVCVRVNATSADRTDAIAAAYTQAAPIVNRAIPSPRAMTADKEPAQILYNIQIIEDREGCMSEYEAIERGAPMMCAESKSLLPAMRALHKHELIRQVSSPKVVCIAGETAQLEIGIGNPENWEGVRLELGSEQVESGLKVELALHTTKDQRDMKVCTALIVEPGQTIVLNANASPAAKEKSNSAQPAVYVIVTPEIIE